jgi:two-component system, OmpR family, sensor kinase
MITRRKFSLRARIALLTALATALLSLLAIAAAFFITQRSLQQDLQMDLNQEATYLTQVYLQNIFIPRGPTKRLTVQIYDKFGFLALSNDPAFDPNYEGNPNNVAIPETLVREIWESGNVENPKAWHGNLSGRPVQAALSPFDLGVIAVLAPTEFIDTVSRQIAERLFYTALGLIALSGLIGYLVAASAMRPVSQLAALAAERGPENLEPIEYQGPNDEVGKLSHVLNDFIARLKSSMDAQRSFLAETSHELRTPLTSLQGFLERASRRASNSSEINDDLGDAKRISITISRLVADLLQLSRGQLVRELVPHLIDPYEDILEPVAEEFSGVKLSGEAGETLVGDPERLRQLIRNLVSNAVRATADPSKVELKMTTDNDAVHLEVTDQGPGIPESMLPHIFEKFYKGPGGGAGLGLAIAKQIAEAHKGKLIVDSTVGKGSSFRLSLPLVTEES